MTTTQALEQTRALCPRPHVYQQQASDCDSCRKIAAALKRAYADGICHGPDLTAVERIRAEADALTRGD